jgi:hypothetical protein
MKVKNITSESGNKIANQFIIKDDFNTVYFQSYNSMIAKKTWNDKGEKRVFLDTEFWNYSRTTSKYRNIFLNETKKETEKKIKDGTYILTNLNREKK